MVKNLTGKQFVDLAAEDQQNLMDIYLNHPIRKDVAVEVKGKKFIKAKFSPCYASSITKLSLASSKNYPKTIWNLETKITILCDCEDSLQEQDLKLNCR